MAARSAAAGAGGAGAAAAGRGPPHMYVFLDPFPAARSLLALKDELFAAGLSGSNGTYSGGALPTALSAPVSLPGGRAPVPLFC